MPNSKARFIILKIVIAVMFAAVIWKLFDLQVLKGEQYYEIANDRMTTNIVEKAPRGEILDRYGTTLVSNKVGYSVVMQKTDVKDEEFNDIIKKLVDIFYSTQCEYYDDLPISFAPYQFKFEDENEDGSVEDEREAWFKNNSHLGKGIEENMSADQIMQAYKEIYKVSDVYSEDEQRRIVGIRYAAEASGLSQTTLFTVADDISVDAVTQIKERQDEFKGIAVINDYIRQYDAPGLATHILGRTGKINAEEYEANKDLGYGYNDIIGKQGIEKGKVSVRKNCFACFNNAFVKPRTTAFKISRYDFLYLLKFRFFLRDFTDFFTLIMYFFSVFLKKFLRQFKSFFKRIFGFYHFSFTVIYLTFRQHSRNNRVKTHFITR